MKKFKVGDKVRLGGSKGCILTIAEIFPDGYKLVDDFSTGFIRKGDAVLVPFKDYEQLKLF